MMTKDTGRSLRLCRLSLVVRRWSVCLLLSAYYHSRDRRDDTERVDRAGIQEIAVEQDHGQGNTFGRKLLQKRPVCLGYLRIAGIIVLHLYRGAIKAMERCRDHLSRLRRRQLGASTVAAANVGRLAVNVEPQHW